MSSSPHDLSNEITIHPEHASNTKHIWKTFWVLSALTIIELGLGYFLYLQHGKISPAMVLGTKIVIGVLTLAKAYYIVSVFMHLGDEIRNFIMTIIVPLTLFIWFIAAFLWDGNSWKTLRNRYNRIEVKTEQHAVPAKEAAEHH
ncbi:cytochrome C oxidase subunit IV family protein [Ferruginibacter sp. SUN002]|uniref:cytochrome C oxidase subunit IV family protein n=1 Tax=Ferruginibacter sp. SUN002 TaxID=2937789 RepID=UPI003D36440C